MPSPFNQLTKTLLCTCASGLLLGTLLPPSFADEMPIVTPEIVGVSSKRLQRLPAAMQRYIDANKLAGTVTLIARDCR